MSGRLLVILVLAIGCGDDDRVPTPTTPELAAVEYRHCLPSELRGAEVAEAPHTSDADGRDEVGATYTEGDGVARVIAVLYRDDAEIAEERGSEAALVEACEGRPDCEPRAIGGVAARVVSLGPIGQESTNLFVEPGIRLAVVASPGRSAAFAELVDLDCLRARHAQP